MAVLKSAPAITLNQVSRNRDTQEVDLPMMARHDLHTLVQTMIFKETKPCLVFVKTNRNIVVTANVYHSQKHSVFSFLDLSACLEQVGHYLTTYR